MELGSIIFAVLIIGILLFAKYDSGKYNMINKLTEERDNFYSQWAKLKRGYDELNKNYETAIEKIRDISKLHTKLNKKYEITKEIIYDELYYNFDEMIKELDHASEELLLFLCDNEYGEFSFSNAQDVDLTKEPLKQFISSKIVKEYEIVTQIRGSDLWHIYNKLEKFKYIRNSEFEKSDSTIGGKHWIELTRKAQFYVKHLMKGREPISLYKPALSDNSQGFLEERSVGIISREGLSQI
jgi:hypothetical protein